MHYVLVWWFKEVTSKQMRGFSGLVVYADDFVVCFQYKSDAEWFYECLKRRMKNFGLSLEEEKSRLIEFLRFAEANCKARGHKPPTFVFLGFTHYCGHSRYGKFRVKRKTSKKKFAKKCKEIHSRLKEMRNWDLKDIFSKLNEVLVGYYHYYGITDNLPSLKRFFEQIKKSLFYWLNRRSQRRSYTWKGFNDMLKQYTMAKPKIYVSIYS